jgi:hypothetical protein
MMQEKAGMGSGCQGSITPRQSEHFFLPTRGSEILVSRSREMNLEALIGTCTCTKILDKSGKFAHFFFFTSVADSPHFQHPPHDSPIVS